MVIELPRQNAGSQKRLNAARSWLHLKMFDFASQNFLSSLFPSGKSQHGHRKFSKDAKMKYVLVSGGK